MTLYQFRGTTMKQYLILTSLVFGLLIAEQGMTANPTDWPQFRGANQDGIAQESQWNPQALANGGKIAWKANLGAGYSGVAISGNRVFTMGNKANKDIVYALNITDGAILWQHAYPCDAGSYAGPRATPATDGKLVYTLGRDGQLFCLNAESGAVKWQKNLITDFQANNLEWGFSASPVIKDHMLLLNAGEHGLVLDRMTGEKIWASPAGVGGYAAPISFKANNTDCLAIFGAKALYGVELKTGKKLWSSKWETSYDVNAADPIPMNDKIFISSGYGKGATVLDISGAKPKAVWTSTIMRNHFSSCVLINGYLYGIDGNTGGGSLKCIDFATGAEKWNHNTGFGSLCAAGDRLVVLNEKGELSAIKASPTAFEQVATAGKILDKTCWTAPVFCRGMIFCRNDKGTLVVLDVSK
jgi:outer membrane protein assembly factor BamB